MTLSREIPSQIRNLLERNPQGLSITDIVKNIRINRNTAGRYLENLLVSGQVEMRHFGMAKIYSLSERLPVSSILSISSDFFLQLDSSLRIVYLNTPFEHLLGVTGKEILGKNIEFSAIPRVLDSAFPPLLSWVKKGVAGTDYLGELRVPALERVFFCRVVPIVFTEGQRGASVILEDITRRKRTEAELLGREQQYRFIVDNSLDIITRLTPTCVCTYVSPSVTPILGYSVEESLGLSLLALVHPEDITRVQEELHTIIKNDISNVMSTFRFRHKAGGYPWFESTINVIRDDETGGILEFLCISRDITARIQSEETARSRDRVLHAFGAASGFLLTGRIKDPFPRVLATMGEAMGADVAYIYKDRGRSDKEARTPENKYRWAKDPARNIGSGRECRVPFPRQWSERLASGIWIAGPRSRFDEPERGCMDEMGVRSILVVPILVKGAYWGFIGCSNLFAEHEWADSEIEILMTLAATIGIVLERQGASGTN